MLRLFFIICSLFILTAGIFAQPEDDRIYELLRTRGEAYISVNKNLLKKSFPPSILPGFDRLDENKVYLYLTLQDTVFIERYLSILNIETPPSLMRQVSMTDNKEEVLNGLAYPTYPLYLEIMEYFQDSFPDLCKIDTIGYSVENRLILAARLNSQGNLPGEVPVAFYSSTIHGDETAGYIFMLMLIDHILKDDDPVTREFIKDMMVIINPLENPDGTYFLSDTTVFGSTRGNANGINLNRNYPDPQDGPNPDGRSRQPESLAMMDYLTTVKPILSANFHGGAEVVNYPFDTWPETHADDAWFRFISSEYASLASSKLEDYMDGFNQGITNGYEWYEVNGGRQDYVTYFLRGRETTIELSNTKLLPEDEILNYWNANKTSLLNYLHQAKYGLHGIVKDSINNKNLKAEVRIMNHDKRNSSVYSDSITGNFFRPIKAGTYDVQFLSSGYRNKVMSDISIKDYERVFLDVNLIPDYVIPSQISILAGPNPFLEEINVYLEIINPGYAFFRVYDLFGNIRVEEFSFFKPGYNKYTLKPRLAPGFYLLEVEFESMVENFRIVKIK
jgi:hypothetical protein